MIKTGPDLYNKSYNKLTAAVFCLDTDCNVRFLKPLIVSNVEICKRLWYTVTLDKVPLRVEKLQVGYKVAFTQHNNHDHKNRLEIFIYFI